MGVVIILRDLTFAHADKDLQEMRLNVHFKYDILGQTSAKIRQQTEITGVNLVSV